MLVSDPNGKRSPRFRDKKYDGSYEWPGLALDFDPVFENGFIESRAFELKNAKNELIKVYFKNNDGRNIYATCAIYLDADVLNVCNQILSTLRFIEQNSSIKIPEIGLEVLLPENYTPSKNIDEPNRAGSFLSYYFRRKKWESGLENVVLSEALYYSLESITKFNESCNDELCFEGSYPTPESFKNDKKMLTEKQAGGKYVIKNFQGIYFLVLNERVIVDLGYSRNYITYFGDARIEISIFMPTEDRSADADLLFSKIKFIQFY